MLSPRTMSLRAKNRALLKALDKYTDIITQSPSSAAGLVFKAKGVSLSIVAFSVKI